MTTFNYTTGNPSNLTAGATASMNDIQGPFTDLRTAINGTLDGDNLSSVAGQQLGLSSSSVIRRGFLSIAATETRNNVAYGTLTTPDTVSVTLPSNGLIAIAYRATWQASVAGAGSAAIFIGATQLKLATASVAAPAVQATSSGNSANIDYPLATSTIGLTGTGIATGTNYGPDVTTGQIIGHDDGASNFRGGVTYVEAAAGTYAVSVQYKASSGTVTAKNRRLWVWVVGF